jgi:glycosyltransferase involved in cell wall biosynthesis
MDPSLLEHGRVCFHRIPKIARSYSLSAPLLARAGRRWAQHSAAAGGRVIVNGGNCRWGDVNWVHYVHAAWHAMPSGNFLKRQKAEWHHRASVRNESLALREARVIITNSARTSRDVIEILRAPLERVQCIYLGVDSEKFTPASCDEKQELLQRLNWPMDRPQALFVGALGDSRKGLDVVLRAWSALAKGDWDVDLNIAGAGREIPKWRAFADDAGIGQQVRFLGFRSDIPSLLRASDLLVAPARYEPYGLNVQEAICCGLPALVSRVSGIAERFPAELSDLLIPDADDVNDLIERLRAWRARMENYRTLVAPFGAQLRSYTWDDMAKAFVDAMMQCA